MAALKFRRFRGGVSKPKRLLGVRPIPTMVTLGNLLCGFAAILLAMRADNPLASPAGLGPAESLYWSGLLIFMAMIFDVMDGRVARWTKSTSQFGMEMDSLCDVVSFGVAPAVLVKATIEHVSPALSYPIQDRYVWLMLGTYVACAAVRLARYNVESNSGHRDFFFGLPVPAAAGCVASLIVMIIIPYANPRLGYLKPLQEKITQIDFLHTEFVAQQEVLLFLPFLMLCLGILMVSRIHYIHVGDRLLHGKKSFMHLLLLGLGFVLVVLKHEIMLVLAFNGYLLLGLANELRYQLFPSQRPSDWISSTDLEPPVQETPLSPSAPDPPAPPLEASGSAEVVPGNSGK